jgi:MFS family permease
MALTRITPDRTLRRARIATSVIFAAHGAVTGTFAARVPWIADHAGIGAGGLGIALLMPGAGALLAMPLSGRLVHRFDLRSLVRVLILCWCAALLLPALPTSLVLLCATLVVYGAAAGLADVAMNAHAVIVEERYERSVMSGFHGWWSVGGLGGSAVATLAAWAGMPAPPHFAIATGTLIVITLLASAWLLPHRPEPEVDAPPAFALPSREVLPIGLIGLCAVFAEGAGVAGIAYGSGLIAPGVIGGIAHVSSLTVSFTLVVGLTLVMGAGASALRPRH